MSAHDWPREISLEKQKDKKGHGKETKKEKEKEKRTKGKSPLTECHPAPGAPSFLFSFFFYPFGPSSLSPSLFLFSSSRLLSIPHTHA
jgi:hypothetical protein